MSIQELREEINKKYRVSNVCVHLKHLNAGIVGVRFKENGRKSFVVVMMSDVNKFIERRGEIVCYEFGTLAGLINANTKPKKYMMLYGDFMREFIRNGNYLCSSILLDI